MRFAWLLFALSVSGCANVPPPQIGERGPAVDDSEAEREYQDLLTKFTARQELYASAGQGADTRMFCAATYQSARFRDARVKRVGLFRAQPKEVVDRNLAVERQEDAQYDDVFFGAYVLDYHFDDFDRHNSAWRLALVTPGGEVTPLSVERIGRADFNMRAFYPYMGDFWNGYRVRFPKAPEPRTTLTFRAASTLGKVELTFPSE